MIDYLDLVLFTFDNHSITIGSLLATVAFIFFINVFLIIIKKSINKYGTFDDGKKYSIYSLLKYFVYVFAFAISLQILGFNISILIAGSAALLVGLGLGIQNLFSDYVSGIIILFDNSVKIGDIIETNTVVCKVIEINLRTTLVLTRDDKYIILPNTDLTRNPLVNWTHNAIAARFEFSVGVSYDSDIQEVKRILKQAAIDHPSILKTQEPFVRFQEFGDSALEFSLYFWSEEVFRVLSIKSELRERILEEFRKSKIEIPFPQRVLHHK